MADERPSHEELKKKIPHEAVRIYVKRGDSRKWIPIEDLRDSDEIQIKKDGNPITSNAKQGRPRNDESTPTVKTYSPAKEEELEKRTNYIKRDPLFQAIRQNPTSDESFNKICTELAEISTALKFERALADSAQDIDPAKKSTIINRHKESVKTLADTILKFRDQNKKSSIDFDGEQFTVMFEHILVTFSECMEEAGVSSELIQTVIIVWQKRVADGWLDEMKLKVEKV